MKNINTLKTLYNFFPHIKIMCEMNMNPWADMGVQHGFSADFQC